MDTPQQQPSPPASHHPKRVMSGMRPTGRLHLGHYLGVLKNWVKLQDQYDCFYMIADWHALTTKYDDTANILSDTREVALDWLASGIDPAKSTVYVQSHIPEIAQLHLIFSMLAPKKWAEMDPTLKDMVQMLHEDLTYGLLGYPVLQTADILIMLGTTVPVGKDQLAHLEISRDIAKRFNHLYQTDLLPEPQGLLTETPMLTGLDGRKMSKSYGNTITLADDADTTWKQIRTGITDKNRIKKDDPGNPEECVAIFPYYQVFGSPEEIETTARECRAGTRGCMDCKKQLAELVNADMAPLRERRATLAADPHQVDQILAHGAQQARETAVEVLNKVKKTMKLSQ